MVQIWFLKFIKASWILPMSALTRIRLTIFIFFFVLFSVFLTVQSYYFRLCKLLLAILNKYTHRILHNINRRKECDIILHIMFKVLICIFMIS